MAIVLEAISFVTTSFVAAIVAVNRFAAIIVVAIDGSRGEGFIL